MVRSLITLVALAAVISFTGCGSSSASCAVTEPTSCPSTPPSYKTNVAPLVQKYCLNCHIAGGEQSKDPLDTYQTLSHRSDDVKDEVGGCDMPPSDEVQPTAAERETILSWIACGTQNN